MMLVSDAQIYLFIHIIIHDVDTSNAADQNVDGDNIVELEDV